MSCERHCEPGSIVKKIKKLPNYEPGAHSNHAYAAIVKQEQETRQADNQKRLKETEKLAKEIVNQIPSETSFPVCVRDKKSPAGEKKYEIYIVDKNDKKIAYASNINEKPKWVSFANFCIFTRIFIKDENDHNVPNPDKIAQLLPPPSDKPENETNIQPIDELPEYKAA